MTMLIDNHVAQNECKAQIEALEHLIRPLNTRLNALSSISQLPLEVFIAICSLVDNNGGNQVDSAITQENRKRVERLPTPITLSHVCQSWREQVFGSPELWTNIKIEHRMSPVLLDLMLQQSRDRPISLRYHDCLSTRPPSHVRTALRALSLPGKLKSVDLRGHEDLVMNCMLIMEGRADSLQCLVISICHPRVFLRRLQMFSGGAPNLRRLELSSCYLPWNSPLLQSPLLTHLILTSVEHTAVSAFQLHQVLRRTPQLQTVHLEFTITKSYELDRETPASLPNLRSLKIRGDRVGLCDFLRGIRIPMSVEVIDILSFDLPANPDQVWSALKCALGDPSLDDFISPRQLRLRSSRNINAVDIKSWREHPTTTAADPSSLIHSPRGQSWKNVCIQFHPAGTSATTSLPFLQLQPETALWNLADLRYLEMNISAPLWTTLSQLPNLEEVVVGPKGDSINFFILLLSCLWEKIREYLLGFISNTVSKTATYPFPALRALVYHKTVSFEDVVGLEMWIILGHEFQMGVGLEYLEIEDITPPHFENIKPLFSLSLTALRKRLRGLRLPSHRTDLNK